MERPPILKSRKRAWKEGLGRSPNLSFFEFPNFHPGSSLRIPKS